MDADVMRDWIKGISPYKKEPKKVYVIVEKQSKNLADGMDGACAWAVALNTSAGAL